MKISLKFVHQIYKYIQTGNTGEPFEYSISPDSPLTTWEGTYEYMLSKKEVEQWKLLHFSDMFIPVNKFLFNSERFRKSLQREVFQEVEILDVFGIGIYEMNGISYAPIWACEAQPMLFWEDAIRLAELEDNVFVSMDEIESSIRGIKHSNTYFLEDN